MSMKSRQNNGKLSNQANKKKNKSTDKKIVNNNHSLDLEYWEGVS